MKILIFQIKAHILNKDTFVRNKGIDILNKAYIYIMNIGTYILNKAYISQINALIFLMRICSRLNSFV